MTDIACLDSPEICNRRNIENGDFGGRLKCTPILQYFQNLCVHTAAILTPVYVKHEIKIVSTKKMRSKRVWFKNSSGVNITYCGAPHGPLFGYSSDPNQC